MNPDIISFIVPVLHERDIIDGLIDHVRSIDPGDQVEIIIVDGSEDGDTISAISRDDVVKVVSEVGRGNQMNYGAKMANGSILVFLHADTCMPGNSIKLIRDTLDGDVYQAGAFTLDFKKASPFLRSTLPIHDIRGRITRIPYGDQVIFMRGETFHQMGGYRNIQLMEDLDLMKRFKRKGLKVKILREKVKTSNRRFRKKGSLKTIIENIFLISLFHLGAGPDKLAEKYYRR